MLWLCTVVFAVSVGASPSFLPQSKHILLNRCLLIARTVGVNVSLKYFSPWPCPDLIWIIIPYSIEACVWSLSCTSINDKISQLESVSWLMYCQWKLMNRLGWSSTIDDREGWLWMMSPRSLYPAYGCVVRDYCMLDWHAFCVCVSSPKVEVKEMKAIKENQHPAAKEHKAVNTRRWSQ